MWFHKLTATVRRWKSIHETIVALEALPTRELDDLGIARWRIPDLARRHAA
jgi:uncharacterized protein YjiS (DUF1127 family)